MKEAQAKAAEPRSGRFKLLKMCLDKTTFAARDLAEFTKYGLNATYIVTVASQCDEFEKLLDDPSTHTPRIIELEHSLRDSLYEIAATGQRIWKQHAAKYRDYLISDHDA